MNTASGYYLNVFDPNGKTDVFVIFNEANSAPSTEDLTALAELVERYLKLTNSPTSKQLQSVVENFGLECVEFGVQVIIR